TEPPVDARVYPELVRKPLQRLDRIQWIRRHHEPALRAFACHDLKRAEQQIEALVRANQAEEEQGLPRPAAVSGGHPALEDRMRDSHDSRARHPELRKLIAASPRLNDDAVDNLEHTQPGLRPPGEHRGEVVRR